jgi:hypothetical protein
MIGAKYGDYGYDVFLICSVTVIGNRLAYITSIGWREFWLRKILLISILICYLPHFYSPSQEKYFTLHTSFTHMPDHLRWSETGRTV